VADPREFLSPEKASPEMRKNFCPECGKFFKHQGALNVHRAVKHGVPVPTLRQIQLLESLHKRMDNVEEYIVSLEKAKDKRRRELEAARRR